VVAAEPRVAVVGVSSGRVCGVRDHATVLARALGEDGWSCTLHWLTREQRSLRAGGRELGFWRRRLASELERERPDAVLLHYSVFAYSHRGLPLFVRPTLSSVRAAGVPVVAFLHELAYPWGLGGWRGSVWAATQRALLIEVMRHSRAAVLTADFRAEWLASRAWLPKRPIAVAPVFSNLPPPSLATRPRRELPRVGVFGYAYEGAAIAPVLDAVALLGERSVPVGLALLGAPGPDSIAGAAWRAGARARGIAEALSFSGPLPAQQLSDELAGCEVLLFGDATGPSSRKGTLAAALASGAPVVAVDGRRSWAQLIGQAAALVVEPSAAALADALEALLLDEAARGALGARGRRFAAESMSVRHSADVVRRLLYEAVAGDRRLTPSRARARA
jgi:glycosyltransferase involved in cell wall biosynthesis